MAKHPGGHKRPKPRPKPKRGRELLALFSVLALLLAMPSAAWAVAEQLSASATVFITSTAAMQFMRCDNSDAITGTDSPTNGETCEAGDWSLPMGCFGRPNLTIIYMEYGAGAGTVKVWNCLDSPGFGKSGEQPPGEAPTPSDPDSFCIDITAGSAVTLDGLIGGVQLYTLTGSALGEIIVEMDVCTGDCDGTVLGTCS